MLASEREWVIPPKPEHGTVRPTYLAEVVVTGGSKQQRSGVLSHWTRKRPEKTVMCRLEYIGDMGDPESTLVWYFLNERGE